MDAKAEMKSLGECYLETMVRMLQFIEAETGLITPSSYNPTYRTRARKKAEKERRAMEKVAYSKYVLLKEGRYLPPETGTDREGLD